MNNVQNTGNPVLDSTVNIVMSLKGRIIPKIQGESQKEDLVNFLKLIHTAIKELATAEPNKSPKSDSIEPSAPS